MGFAEIYSGNLSELATIQIGECAVFRHQFPKISLFQNRAVFHHKNQIRIFNRGQAVSDNDASFAPHQFIKSLAQS